jgi:hypothetical protein
MTKNEESEVIRVCGADYDEWDIPPGMRNREDIVTVESIIPICQGRNDYIRAAADHAERISN